MADSLACCNKSERDLLILIAEQQLAIFDRLQQTNDIIGSGTAGDATAGNQINCQQKTQITDALCNAVAVTGASLNVNGSVAHDSPDANNPLKIGGQARTTNPASVVDSDRVNFIGDKAGKQVVVGSIRELKSRQVTTITSSVVETTIVTAGAAGVFKDLYGLLLSNTSATATEVLIRDATAAGTISSFMVPSGATVGFMLPESGAWPQGTAANNWTATCVTSVASVKVTALTVSNL